VLNAYLMPPFGLFYGALFLGEPLSMPKLVGLVLILGGIALGSGALAFRRAAVQTP
jgi:drug/metabolite transporter (DMT)-like permease